MLLHIPALLTAEEVRTCREHMEQAYADGHWQDGRTTAGHLSAAVKSNLQLPLDSPLAAQLGNLILDRLATNPLFIAAALPLKVLPPRFNRYEGGGTKTVSMFSKLMNQGSSFVMEGVKNLVVKKHNLPVTKIVDELMESKQSSRTDDYLYLDPKQLKHTEQMPKNRPTFQDVIVFVVGGGNYIEYQNLVDYVKQRSGAGVNKRVIYGSTTFINAKQLLKQLSLLGQEVHS